jgi:3-phenylpropionate/cinnamic acid dioxygenase small subunit
MTNRGPVQSPEGMADTDAWSRVAEPQYADIREFLFSEAELLDERHYDKWFALLAPEIEYRVVARVVRGASAEPREFLILDDRQIDIKTRIDQVSNPKLTYAENPAPSTRRFVTNVRATTNPASDMFKVSSYIFLYRKDAWVSEPYLISAARRDLLRSVGGELRLVKRSVSLDQSVITSANLATFL